MKIAHLQARHTRQEALARLIAAEKMGLLRDPLGQKLPDDIWQRYLAHAHGVLTLIRVSEVTHEAGDEWAVADVLKPPAVL